MQCIRRGPENGLFAGKTRKTPYFGIFLVLNSPKLYKTFILYNYG